MGEVRYSEVIVSLKVMDFIGVKGLKQGVERENQNGWSGQKMRSLKWRIQQVKGG